MALLSSTERYYPVCTNILLGAGANATRRRYRLREALTKALEHQAGADYTRADNHGDLILQDVALYGDLGTIDFIRAAKLSIIYIKATNEKGKRAPKKA
ncbi:hypothetical protein N7G274_004208 [Stereocaulon virgatum]|uniref:Uncharacterized protein n=1 Tax=Stereocaulon virgatum TaxID=373712 RepID=A0ABR4AIA7_9LECA